jgi:hypothetical protein
MPKTGSASTRVAPTKYKGFFHLAGSGSANSPLHARFSTAPEEKKSRCRMIEFSELQSYYCQSICQRMFFSVLSTAKSIPEQMSKSQRCNFLHAAFRFSPHPPIIHHSSPPSFVIINQYPIFILNISILHHAHVSALTTLGFKDYIEPFTSSTTTSSAISRAREKVATGAAHQQKADTPLFAHNGVVGYGMYVMPLCYGR